MTLGSGGQNNEEVVQYRLGKVVAASYSCPRRRSQSHAKKRSACVDAVHAVAKATSSGTRFE